jgi:hypothetical protein
MVCVCVCVCVSVWVVQSVARADLGMMLYTCEGGLWTSKTSIQKSKAMR